MVVALVAGPLAVVFLVVVPLMAVSLVVAVPLVAVVSLAVGLPLAASLVVLLRGALFVAFRAALTGAASALAAAVSVPDAVGPASPGAVTAPVAVRRVAFLVAFSTPVASPVASGALSSLARTLLCAAVVLAAFRAGALPAAAGPAAAPPVRSAAGLPVSTEGESVVRAVLSASVVPLSVSVVSKAEASVAGAPRLEPGSADPTCCGDVSRLADFRRAGRASAGVPSVPTESEPAAGGWPVLPRRRDAGTDVASPTFRLAGEAVRSLWPAASVTPVNGGTGVAEGRDAAGPDWRGSGCSGVGGG
ncbi:hypothetical protein ACIBQ2_22535 [Micromonospora sediminimaris]|uniref:hypothetical protein n=1 Tax=Micromonospora sediminimaris TaxID=547162 RepID=UPI00378A9DFF